VLRLRDMVPNPVLYDWTESQLEASGVPEGCEERVTPNALCLNMYFGMHGDPWRVMVLGQTKRQPCELAVYYVLARLVPYCYDRREEAEQAIAAHISSTSWPQLETGAEVKKWLDACVEIAPYEDVFDVGPVRFLDQEWKEMIDYYRDALTEDLEEKNIRSLKQRKAALAVLRTKRKDAGAKALDQLRAIGAVGEVIRDYLEDGELGCVLLPPPREEALDEST
jgi:hypothetical protein